MQEAYENREIAKALQKSEDGIRGITVGNDVYEALNFADASAQKILRFTTRQYRFLNAYRLGVSFQEACSKAGLSPEQAERFLQKADTVAWLQDRALKDHIKREWEEPGKWYEVGEEMRNMDEVPKHKLEIWKEFGDRAVPKQSRNADSGNSTKIEIIIDPGAHERSKERRAAIEAQIVKDEKVAWLHLPTFEKIVRPI